MKSLSTSISCVLLLLIFPLLQGCNPFQRAKKSCPSGFYRTGSHECRNVVCQPNVVIPGKSRWVSGTSGGDGYWHTEVGQVNVPDVDPYAEAALKKSGKLCSLGSPQWGNIELEAR